MNTILSLNPPKQAASANPRKADDAFTLLDLLVVVGVIVVLTLTLLPALGSNAQKGGRFQCAANLRQIGAASMLYANDFRSWLPIWFLNDGVHPLNVIRNLNYTRYVCLQGPAFSQVPQSYTNSYIAAGGSFQNLGFLYAGKYIGPGDVLYCPAQTGTALGEDFYLPLLKTDSTGVGRASYAFNPRVTDPFSSSPLRQFQKTSQLAPGKVFAVDYLAPGFFAHNRERGWNVLLTDGSTKP